MTENFNLQFLLSICLREPGVVFGMLLQYGSKLRKAGDYSHRVFLVLLKYSPRMLRPKNLPAAYVSHYFLYMVLVCLWSLESLETLVATTSPATSGSSIGRCNIFAFNTRVGRRGLQLGRWTLEFFLKWNVVKRV